MLYRPGTHLGEAAASAVGSTQVCLDADYIINNWDPETMTVQRNVPSWDSVGHAVDNWGSAGLLVGDWQPVTGRTIREEEGREVKSDAFIIAGCSVTVEEDDRIYRSDGSFMYVNYVRRFKGHTTIYLKRTKGSN